MKVRDRVNSLGDRSIKMNGDEILSSRYLKYTNKEQVERIMEAKIYTEITGIDKTTLVILEGIPVLFTMMLHSIIKDEAILEVIEYPLPLRNWIKHIYIFVGAAICSRLPRIYKRTKNYIENKSRIDIFTDFLKTLDLIQLFLLVVVVGFATFLIFAVLIIKLVSFSF